MSPEEVDLNRWPADMPIPLVPTGVPTLAELEAILALDLVDEPRRPREVVHLYWVGRNEPRTLCGLHDDMSKRKPTDRVVEVVGGLMPLPEYRDCKRCVRVLEARARAVRRT